jgi:hypothetical protein|uniref:Uncharacterized protein n=2 Tax=unclassified Caudoviricetes TaxID=2788787 RepID=A0A8S5PIZ1_9CAUD|nr:MAG TPA: hypothetical protein [Siphoviridae sp. ctJcm18]DAE06688.1 MAG TPA: hypothetical protein [Siphoviridae sp. ctUGQ45]DAV73419.1 MAG TPA: hypothetical protein [Bacteriophage sp.]
MAKNRYVKEVYEFTLLESSIIPLGIFTNKESYLLKNILLLSYFISKEEYHNYFSLSSLLISFSLNFQKSFKYRKIKTKVH